MSDALWGSTVASTTSDSDGDFSQTPLYLGRHTVTYSNSGYFDTNAEGLLETDGQTLDLETVRMIPDNCTSGTISGKITDAVDGSAIINAWIGSYKYCGRFCGWKLAKDNNTNSSGEYSFSDMDPGRYALRNTKSGYSGEWFYVNACGSTEDQNNSLSKHLNEGEMRIILKWPKTTPETGKDLDSHLQIPDNANSTFHVYAPTSTKIYYYATDNYTCPSCSSDQLSDNVTLDKDHNNNSSPASPPGDETITISKVRSGTYSFSVHDFTNKSNSSITKLGQSGAKVKVIYCPVGADCSNEEAVVRKNFHVKNANGTLWEVFTFNSSDSGGSGFTRVRTMTYEFTPEDVY